MSTDGQPSRPNMYSNGSFRSRVLGKGASVLNKGSELLQSREVGQGAANQLSNFSARLSTASQDFARPTIPDGSEGPSTRSRAWNSLANSALPSAAGGNARWGSYFTSERREDRKAQAYTEERCISFPGYAVLRNRQNGGPPHLDVEISGYAFRTRPLDQATRTQRVFVSIARQFAGLSKIPSSAAPPASDLEASGAPEIKRQHNTALERERPSRKNTPDQLLALGQIRQDADDDEVERMMNSLNLTEEPDEYSEDEYAPETPKLSAPTVEPSSVESQRTITSREVPPIPPRPTNRPARPQGPAQRASDIPALTANLDKPSPLRHSNFTPDDLHSFPTIPPSQAQSDTSSISSLDSNGSRSVRQRITSKVARKPSTSSTISHIDFEGLDMMHLHANLSERLRAFFSQKLEGRRVRISVFRCASGTEEERCLARGTVLTKAGGGFKQTINLDVGDKENWVDEKIRVVTELLPSDEDATAADATGRADMSLLTVMRPGIPRVISDIDDTCKHTHILGGTRSIFRTVFCLPYDRISVSGMAEWYNAMMRQGAGMHYVSNGPWELSEVIVGFMKSVGLPDGQVKLKEYGQGSSLLSGMWESASDRKRQNVEEILRSFPESQFVLVGDSGEQDLELYSTIAAEYPGRVLAIFLRDVTTPISVKMPSLSRRNSLLNLSDAGSSSSKTSVRPPKPTRKASDYMPDVLHAGRPRAESISDTDTDFLSPNNPLRNDDFSLTRLVTGFYKRIADAEEKIPDNVVFRVFRSGEECHTEGVEIIRQAMEQRGLQP